MLSARNVVAAISRTSSWRTPTPATSSAKAVRCWNSPAAVEEYHPNHCVGQESGERGAQGLGAHEDGATHVRRIASAKSAFSLSAVLVVVRGAYGLVRMVPAIPTATNLVPVHVTPRILWDIGTSLGSIHASPSLLCTMVPRSPTATKRVPPQATSCSQSRPDKDARHLPRVAIAAVHDRPVVADRYEPSPAPGDAFEAARRSAVAAKTTKASVRRHAPIIVILIAPK